MSSPVTALLLRTINTQERSWTPFAWRGLATAFLALQVLFVLGSSSFVAGGRQLFETIFYVNVYGICIAGVSYYALAITEEKEQWTLGILRLTKLTPFWLLSGKAICQFILTLELLAVQIPFLCLAVALGGVTTLQVVASYLSLICFLALIVFFAQFLSVCLRTSREAAFGMMAMLFLMILGPWICHIVSWAVNKGRVQPLTGAAGWFEVALGHLHSLFPIAHAGKVLAPGYQGPIWSSQMTISLGAGVLCFLWSWFLFERCNSDGDRPRSLGVWGKAKQLLGRPRVWSRSHLWLELNYHAGGRAGFLLRLVCYTGLGYFFADVLRLTPILLQFFGLAFFLEISFFVSRTLHREVWGGTLSALLLLPHSTSRLLLRKLMGCFMASSPSFLGFVLISWRQLQHDFPTFWGFLLVCFHLISGLLCFLVALLYFSVVMPRGAFLVALAVVVATHLLIALLFSLLALLLGPLASLFLFAIFWEWTIRALRRAA